MMERRNEVTDGRLLVATQHLLVAAQKGATK